MSAMSRAAGGSRLLSLSLFGLLLASGCRSSTSTGEPAGKVESAPETPVTLNLGPATLDSFGADSGASCSDAGPPLTGLDGGASCGATLAASTFQYAICSCGSLQSTGVLTTDGYDSTKGGPTEALGANVGFNASAAWSSAPSLGGNLFSPGGISAPKGGLVRGDVHLGGAVAGGGQTFTVDGNAFVEATLPSSVKVLGTVTHVSSVAAPCNCGSPLPISSLVSAHAAPNNEDSAIGLSASAAGGGNPSQIDLPCGDFYLTVISPSKPLTIAAHGHTELYISGSVSASSALTFSIDPGASLDLFVAGGFSATSTLSLGSVSSPASCRVYVAGSQFQVPSSASIACNIYAPSASIALPSTVAYGSIFSNGVTASGSATLHYDTSIENGTCATCTAASCNDGNPCTVDTCNSNGTCSHANAANDTSCPTGANVCDQSYTCQAGACVGSNPVVCAAQDQCHGVGSCNQSTGVCSNPALANGTSCNDGNACTRTDSCTAGVCTGSNPVTCTAPDSCHSPGACNASTGVCSAPTLNAGFCYIGGACVASGATNGANTCETCQPGASTAQYSNVSNGTSCNDGSACTLSDSCQGGICVGANPVVCTAQDACHAVGTCNTATGACSNPTAPDGTACTGTNLCDHTYACSAGTCTGSNPVTCTALDACHVAGQCQSATGTCTNPTAPNGTSCNDNNLCTANDVCTGGACAGSPVTCVAQDQCHTAGTCSPASGVCSNPTMADGTACNDNNACTQSDSCIAGTCTGSNPVVCAPVDVCHTAGACNPTSGACSNPSLSTCTTVDRTVVSTIASTTAFLYSGSNPIQTGVAPGTIVATRAAVLRGRVLDHSSNPISGVAVSILNHPEFGATTTVADGTFSMAVNGGSVLTVAYAATGFLPMQRTMAHAPWNDYAMVPDVMLTSVDVATTSITFGSSAGYQVARATTVTDEDGTRTATLLVPPNTQAEMVTGTSSVPVSTLTVRATEYTVGTAGPSAMPGDLPTSSGYTYAVELTADEELALGPNASVVFATPIVSYTDNFLGFGVGQHVPVGSYDRATAQWVPSPDGLVIGIVSITGGVANIDINGDGVADSAAALAAVGITVGEQAELASMYSAPTSLWRVPVYHFSDPWDFNWPVGPQNGSTPPMSMNPGPPPLPDCHAACCGSGPDGPDGPGPNGTGDLTPRSSRLECQNGILHESIPLAGTPYSLTYSSDRVAGYAAENHLLIPMSSATLPPGVLRIDLEVDVAGSQFTASFPPTTNLNTTFDWDGKDFLGRTLQGVQTASVSVGYVYQGVYLTPAEKPVVSGGAPYNSLFGHFSYFGAPATGDRSRQQITLWQRSQAPIGHFSAESLGLGGWEIDAQHVYEPPTSMLRLGDGARQPADAFGKIVTTFAGTGAPGGAGDGGPAISADLNGPWNVAVGPDGSVYISDRNNLRIRKVDGQGTITNVVGNGSRGFNGDNIAATAASLNNPEFVLLAADGSLYFSDVANQRVRRVDPQGIIHTVAGNGSQGYSGDGGPATSAAFSNPDDLALSPDGSLYIADTLNSVIRRVDPAGIVSTVVGVAGTENANAVNFNGDNQPAAQALINAGRGLALSPDGVLFVVDCFNHRVRRVGTDGIITTYAGTGTAGFSGDNGPATSAQLTTPLNLALSSDGTLYVSDIGTMRIRAIAPGGIITTVAGNGAVGYSGDHGPALDATFNPPGPLPVAHTFGITLGSDKLMYVADGDNNVVRRLSLSQPAFTNAALSVASVDGSQVYGFDAFGKHLGTQTLPTGSQTLGLGYDTTSDLLTTLSELDGNQVINVTTIQRDGAGNPTAIVSPFGVPTSLALGADGYLATVTDPTGAIHQMAYQNGLLTEIQFPTGSPTIQSTKTYDSLGRIATSTDAAGGKLSFVRAADALASVSVTKTTSQNVPSSYAVSLSTNGASHWTTQWPGTANPSTLGIGPDGSKTITSPDGTVTSYQGGPDPRFGMGVPLAKLVTTTLPISGITSSTAASRNVTLSNPLDPLSLTAETDTTVVNGNTWTRAFAAGPPATWTTTSPVGRTSSMTIDPAGRPLTTSVPNVAPFSFLYDSHGRLQQRTQGTRTWLTGYDANGYASSQTDPLSHTVSTLNDLDGRPLTTTLQDQRQVGTSWDGDGNMLNITLPGALAAQPDPSREHQFSFTAVDLTQTYTPPNIGVGLPSTSYSYDADRFLKTITRPDGIVVTHVPDAFERLSQVQYPQGSLSYSYSPTTGQLLSTTTPSGETTTFTYDGFLQKSITWSGPVAGSIGFGYNSDFHVTTQSLNSGTPLPFGYDADGLVTCAGASTCPAAGALGLTLDLHNGRLNATALGNVADSYGYDPNGLLASYAATFSGSARYSETVISRDLNGRITEKTDVLAGTSHDWKYAYDPAGRLTDVTEDGTFEAHYAYDGDDNRTTSTKASGTVNPTYDVQDRLITYGPATYAFTANGELTSKTVGGQVTSYTYDALGNLLHVGLPAALPDGAQTIDYIVDGQNRRVGRMVNGTLVQGWLYQDQLRPAAQLDGSNNVVARFVYGSKPNVPDYMVTFNAGGTVLGTYRILSDHLGSPRLVVDAGTGSVIETINFDEFGNETDTLAGTLPTGYVRIPFAFAGGLYDLDTGLVRFGERDYDASLGRWTSKDPDRFGHRELNLFAYAGADPINRHDPTGRFDEVTCSLLEAEVLAVCLATYGDYTGWTDPKRIALICNVVALIAYNACLNTEPDKIPMACNLPDPIPNFSSPPG